VRASAFPFTGVQVLEGVENIAIRIGTGDFCAMELPQQQHTSVINRL
jgi:hypothetical protein